MCRRGVLHAGGLPAPAQHVGVTSAHFTGEETEAHSKQAARPGEECVHTPFSALSGREQEHSPPEPCAL